jgi:predicted RecB family endonuclease
MSQIENLIAITLVNAGLEKIGNNEDEAIEAIRFAAKMCAEVVSDSSTIVLQHAVDVLKESEHANSPLVTDIRTWAEAQIAATKLNVFAR